MRFAILFIGQKRILLMQPNAETAGIKVLYVECVFDLPYEEASFFQATSSPILHIIATFKPDVIVSCGRYPVELNNAPFEVRKRWINVDPSATKEYVKWGIEYCYADNLWRDSKVPLITVYTPTFNGKLFLPTAFNSLIQQTYTNWEWVVVDDGSADDTYALLLRLANQDCRVRPFSMPHSGKIGEVKGVATKLAYGSLLVEFDHDDLLINTALEEVELAFRDSSVGMIYTNCAEFYDDGRPDNEYKDSFWTDRYRDTEYRGRVYREARAPTIYGRWGMNYWDRHAWYLTTGPNHLRAYRASELARLGGYNHNLPVADDWDVFYRFFLYSKCIHIDKMLYLQRFTPQSATWMRNQSIQHHLALARNHYAEVAKELDNKLPSLPSKDFDLTNPK